MSGLANPCFQPLQHSLLFLTPAFVDPSYKLKPKVAPSSAYLSCVCSAAIWLSSLPGPSTLPGRTSVVAWLRSTGSSTSTSSISSSFSSSCQVRLQVKGLFKPKEHVHVSLSVPSSKSWGTSGAHLPNPLIAAKSKQMSVPRCGQRKEVHVHAAIVGSPTLAYIYIYIRSSTCAFSSLLRAGFFIPAGFLRAGFFLTWAWQWHKQGRSVHKVYEPALSSMAGFFRTAIASTTSLCFQSSSWYCKESRFMFTQL